MLEKASAVVAGKLNELKLEAEQKFKKTKKAKKTNKSEKSEEREVK